MPFQKISSDHFWFSYWQYTEQHSDWSQNKPAIQFVLGKFVFETSLAITVHCEGLLLLSCPLCLLCFTLLMYLIYVLHIYSWQFSDSVRVPTTFWQYGAVFSLYMGSNFAMIGEAKLLMLSLCLTPQINSQDLPKTSLYPDSCFENSARKLLNLGFETWIELSSSLLVYDLREQEWV